MAHAPAARAEDVARAKLLELRNAVLKDGKTALDKAMKSAEKSGKVVGARYELRDGKLRLGVWVIAATGPVEVVVNPKTGKADAPVALAGADADAAKAAEAAMAKATTTLADALKKDKPAKAKAMTVTVELKDARPYVTLVYALPGPTDGAWSQSSGVYID